MIAVIEVTSLTYASLALAGFMIGMSKAGLGGASAPFLAAIVALTLPVDLTLGVLLPMTIIGDFFAVRAVRGEWDLSLVKLLLPGALVGIALGTFVLWNISERGLRILMAALILVFLVWRLVQRQYLGVGEMGEDRKDLPKWIGTVAGIGGGFGSAVATIGSPPIVMYLLATNVAPRMFVATSAAFFPAVNLLKAPGYFAAGVVDVGLIWQTAWTWLAIPCGAWVGRRIITKIKPGPFEKLTLVLMLGGAILLLIRV